MIEIDPRTLAGRAGEEIGVSDWLEISQGRIDSFADATDDHQWIHVDPARAAADSPFETTVAHGFLTLALVPALLRATIRLPARMTLNYGSNRVRFVSPVPAGARIRGAVLNYVLYVFGAGTVLLALTYLYRSPLWGFPP